MERLTIDPRPDWKSKVEKLGLLFHTGEQAYWDESVCYQFSAAEIDILEAATNELHRLCLEAVQYVIDARLFARFGISERYVSLILDSWEREDLSLYGRFDLFYDGQQPPRMYEYNADTPTSLLEASVVQWDWLQERSPRFDQFNSIHEKLVARWQESGLGESVVHFACVRDHLEDFATTVYLQDTALQAGLGTSRLFMDEIGWNGTHFVDRADRPITHLFKLYPWEWLIDERFSPHLLLQPWQLIEPAWKMLLSNKAILPVLWELFPEHPNLLPAYTSPEALGGTFVRKPALGREGVGITTVVNGREIETTLRDEEVADRQYIYQALLTPLEYAGFHPVIGSWIARDEAAGIGIRESQTAITQNTSRFIPHMFVP
jgi:glutathionylspermidine synthase